MTYSITARDPETGQYGVAVASRFFAVGALVPHIRGGKCAVATQAFVSPIWGLEAADRMARGEVGADVLTDLVARDGGQAIRQIHMIDSTGSVAAHTGSGCVDCVAMWRARGCLWRAICWLVLMSLPKRLPPI